MEHAHQINILEGIQLLVQAWKFDVKEHTISNCFAHCKIRTPEFGAPEITEEMLTDDDVMTALAEQIKQLRYDDPMDVSNFLNYPAEQQITYTPTEDDIIQEVRGAYSATEDCEEIDDSEEIPKVTTSEAIRMMNKLTHFWLQQDGDQNENLMTISKMRDATMKIHSEAMVQQTLHSYFKSRE